MSETQPKESRFVIPINSIALQASGSQPVTPALRRPQRAMNLAIRSPWPLVSLFFNTAGTLDIRLVFQQDSQLLSNTLGTSVWR